MDPEIHLHNFVLIMNFIQLLQLLAVRRRHSCLSVFIAILLSSLILQLFVQQSDAPSEFGINM